MQSQKSASPARSSAQLEAEHGRQAVEAMRAIKRALDPDDLMNPARWSRQAQRISQRMLNFSPSPSASPGEKY